MNINTNNIKSFAKKARLILLEGVSNKLSYWGFKHNGDISHVLSPTAGGYVFRGDIYTDTHTLPKWNLLKTKIKDKQAYTDIVEQAAYTWFNRLVAIKILEQNLYIKPQLAFAEGLKTPLIVQNAKRGIHNINNKQQKQQLEKYLLEEDEDSAFAMLITHFCNENPIIQNVFGKLDDFTEILLPTNLFINDGFLDLLNSQTIAPNEYKEVELIGWLYQFYISDKKDEVFKGLKNNKKARAEDIPAATQIFTPKWIVKYMVENTVGKIYLDYQPSSKLRAQMKYLVENEADKNNTATIISDLTQLTLIDPASGSGHILVTGFELLFDMYREAGYNARQAVENILTHNLFGLDIDDRAMQLARFAVLLKAAQYHKEILESGLIPKVYSFPEAYHFTTEQVKDFLGNEGQAHIAQLKEALMLLNQGKNIGAALKLQLSQEARALIAKKVQEWQKLEQQAGGLDIEQKATWQYLQPFLQVLLAMTQQYTAVVANPPYMGQKSMNGELKDYVNTHYPVTKSDLMTIFMEVIPNLTADHSRFALINLPSWLFLSSFEKIRQDYIDNFTFDSLLHMGRGIFGIDFGSVAFAIKKTTNKDAIGSYFRLHERNFQHIYYEDIQKLFLYSNNNEAYKYDFAQYRGDEGITEIPKQGTTKGLKLFYPNIPQTNFSKIPGSPIAYWVTDTIQDIFNECEKLENVSNPRQGMKTLNNELFIHYWYEVSMLKFKNDAEDLNETDTNKKKWYPINHGGGFRKWYGNNLEVVNWENNGREIKKLAQSKYNSITRTVTNISSYLKIGITWGTISSGAPSFRAFPKGFFFSNSGQSLIQKNGDEQLYITSLLNSKVTHLILEILTPGMGFESGYLKKIPYKTVGHFEFSRAKLVIERAKKDWDSRETSWDFEKSPLLMVNGELSMVNEAEGSSLSHAYQLWQELVTKDFFQLHANEEELNRIFIDIYGLQEELTPEVALKDITILQDELDRNALEALEPVFRKHGKDAISLPINKAEVISQFLSYSIGVFLGRYRLDKPGLNIAHPNPTEEETAKYQYNAHNIEIDEDGIVPLMGENCAFADDALVRTKGLVHAVWGENALTENINFINEALGMDLHKWLTEKFWKFHTSMYKKKPIYWLFSSNVNKPQNAAFKVLVYMHRMDKYTVQKIQRNYLHKQQAYIRQQIEKLKANETNLNREEGKHLETLLNWEIECRTYNETLKELANLQIEFDLDDGVDVNYAKFEGAVAVI